IRPDALYSFAGIRGAGRRDSWGWNGGGEETIRSGPDDRIDYSVCDYWIVCSPGKCDIQILQAARDANTNRWRQLMTSLDKYVYAALAWPEINEAVLAKKVLLLPIGSTEQHGHHLPLDVDNFLARSVCIETAKLAPREMLVMPTIPYGYNEHALDFPGTIHV